MKANKKPKMEEHQRLSQDDG